ncbi:uncharacterized protein PSFLO_05790 [Pseudozyma flocculosa]|uniref:Uncharacterized protein n=1 Tax=Pseudozyma flocculosa TaxID=84751 RepID=A0A5C3F761_9BASI|nr:uncharacterized protein PSFLO_05790 [Pseudozyma flocculosa]
MNALVKFLLVAALCAPATLGAPAAPAALGAHAEESGKPATLGALSEGSGEPATHGASAEESDAPAVLGAAAHESGEPTALGASAEESTDSSEDNYESALCGHPSYGLEDEIGKYCSGGLQRDVLNQYVCFYDARKDDGSGEQRNSEVNNAFQKACTDRGGIYYDQGKRGRKQVVLESQGGGVLATCNDAQVNLIYTRISTVHSLCGGGADYDACITKLGGDAKRTFKKACTHALGHEGYNYDDYL